MNGVRARLAGVKSRLDGLACKISPKISFIRWKLPSASTSHPYHLTWPWRLPQSSPHSLMLQSCTPGLGDTITPPSPAPPTRIPRFCSWHLLSHKHHLPTPVLLFQEAFQTSCPASISHRWCESVLNTYPQRESRRSDVTTCLFPVLLSDTMMILFEEPPTPLAGQHVFGCGQLPFPWSA